MLQAMRDHPTFLEYLLDRSTESEQEGHILKYNVIRNLVHTSSAHQIFSSSTLLKLKVGRYCTTAILYKCNCLICMLGGITF